LRGVSKDLFLSDDIEEDQNNEETQKKAREEIIRSNHAAK